MKTQERREFSAVGVEARYPAPRAWIHPDTSRGWIRRLTPIMWAHKRAFLTAWLATLLTIFLALVSPAVVRKAVNLMTTGDFGSVRRLVVILALLALARFAIGYVARYQMLNAAYGIEYDLRAIIYEQLTRLSFAFYDRVQSGQLISRANSDIRSVQMFLAFAPTMAIQFVTFAFALAFMLSIHPMLTLVTLLPLPGVFVLGMKMRKLMFPISWIVQARMADVATIVDENVTGVRIVKSFAAEMGQIGELAKAARRVQWANIKQVDVRARYASVLENLPRLSLVLVLFYGGYLVLHHQLDLGSIVLFSAYIVFLTSPFRILGFMLMLSNRAHASAERIDEIIDSKPDVVDRPGAVDLIAPRGSVEFRDVTFGYADDPPVLNSFSMRMERGETVALVGRTGCGKSTVARLLMRFYDVREGAVLVDDTDVRDLTQESLRSHIGFVADDAFLFSDSIRANIAYARPDASIEDVVAAAKASGADEFIRQLPDGYDTIIGERGYDLSGGQRQRVSIARLLVRDPAILILDDATSSVDVQIEQEIHDALNRVMEGRTTLVIAHRLSTINLADRVVLMEGGSIIAAGAHADLMRTEPRYAEVLARLAEETDPPHVMRTDGNGKRPDPEGEFEGFPMGTQGGFGGPGGFGAGFGGGPRTAAAAGLPFAGIPPELQQLAEKILATEPDHGEESVEFSRIAPAEGRFTLRKFIAPHKWWLLGSFAFVAIEAVAANAGPNLTGRGIDKVLAGKGFKPIVVIAMIYLAAVVGSTISGRFRVAWTGRVGERLMFSLRVRIFTHLQRLGLDFYTREKAGRVMTRMTSDVEALQQLFNDGLVNLVVQGMQLAVVAGILFTMHALLAMITLAFVVPLMTVFTLWFRRASDRGFLAVRERIADVLADLQESLSGVRIVAAYNRQRHNIVKHRNILGEHRDANLYTGKVSSIYGPGSDAIGVLGQVLIILVGSSMVAHHTLSIGKLVAFVLYLATFFAPIQQLVSLYNTYQQGRAAVTKLRDVFDEQPEPAESPDAVDLPDVEGDIRLEHVTFGYDPERPVLDGVDLHITPGETFALVGPTGAGKSTVVKLIARFYDPNAGRILVDGHDVRSVKQTSLRRQIGNVPQEPFLFAGSIRDNIAFARPEATLEDVWEACRAVGIEDLIDRLPDGLDTPCHERGVSLSSGERQLLALARAFLARPRVLILDEATSNLDLKTESKIERALDLLLEGRTAIIIAHRLSTAMRADRLAVVEDGRIAELGTHDELVAMGGRYANMYETWMSHAAGVEMV